MKPELGKIVEDTEKFVQKHEKGLHKIGAAVLITAGISVLGVGATIDDSSKAKLEKIWDQSSKISLQNPNYSDPSLEQNRKKLVSQKISCMVIELSGVIVSAGGIMLLPRRKIQEDSEVTSSSNSI
jgi:hypothetical protein